MICLLVATSFEAGDLVDQSKEFDYPSKIVLNDRMILLLTGAGPVNAGLALGEMNDLLKTHPKIQFINVGIAGSLKKHDLLTVHFPTRFRFDCGAETQSASPGLLKSCYPDCDLFEGDRIVTVPAPLWNKQYGQVLASQGGDLVDMEAYVFARWAELNSASMRFVKIVSDRGDEDEQSDFMANARLAVKELSRGLKSLRELISKQDTVNLKQLKYCFGIHI